MTGIWIAVGLFATAIVFTAGFHLGVRAAVDDYEARLERVRRLQRERQR